MFFDAETHIPNIEIPEKNVFYFYGDNTLESLDIIELIEKNNKDLKKYKTGLNSLKRIVKQYKHNETNEIYTFVALQYYHNGKLPRKVRKILVENDKPDVIIYSNDRDEVIFGVENTSSTLAGNATWQRSARIMSFAKNHIPFAFIGYYQKIDQSSQKKTIRKASDLFVAMMISCTLYYSSPTLAGFYEHSDPAQNSFIGKVDGRIAISKYLFSIIVNSQSLQKQFLEECLQNMRLYYYGYPQFLNGDNVFGENGMPYVKNTSFPQDAVLSIQTKKKAPLFTKQSLIDWKPESTKWVDDDSNCGFREGEFDLKHIVNDELKERGVKCYQLTKNCKAGITFDTDKLIEYLEDKSSYKGYFEDYLSPDRPTVILHIHFRKKQNGVLSSTDDPYNGEIPAFKMLYTESFGDVNLLLIVVDRDSASTYPVERSSKLHKTINQYVDLALDRDFNKLPTFFEGANDDTKKHYEEIRVTENDITSLQKFILDEKRVVPSFINAPCGSWSDLRLYPSTDYIYSGRNDNRGDIAFYVEDENTYYVGENKDKKANLMSNYALQIKKIMDTKQTISDRMSPGIDYKTFVSFAGTEEDAHAVLKKKESINIDFVLLIKDEKGEETVVLTIERDK